MAIFMVILGVCVCVSQVIQLSGYTLEEKVHIAQSHLLPRLLEDHGLGPANVHFTDGVMEYIVDR